MNGYIDFLKPPGMSSAAAVAFIKSLTREKCGHSGTLDPEVAGVLPVMVGRATRLQQFFSDKTKAYVGEICFTGATDTQDAQGKLIQPGTGAPTSEALRRVIRERFLGDIWQVPPMYSAVKRAGKPLYALARAGANVDVPARSTRIERCEILSQADEMTYRIAVECGSGTYVRTLFHDIGQALGCPAHMRMLIRTRSGCFGMEDSVTAEVLSEAVVADRLERWLMPMDTPLAGYREIRLDACQKRLARNGVPLPAGDFSLMPGELATVYSDGIFYGMAEAKVDGVRMAFLADP